MVMVLILINFKGYLLHFALIELLYALISNNSKSKFGTCNTISNKAMNN